MPSPFPGMDPFIELKLWPDFHADFIVAVREQLVAQVRPRYAHSTELRVYSEADNPSKPPEVVRPDLALADTGDSSLRSGAAVADKEATLITLPMPVEGREPYLEVRSSEAGELVAVLEALSPGNKRIGRQGRGGVHGEA